MSTTDYRGYAEVPANVAPDVPHYVNKALRQIDADVEAATVQSAAEVAALAAALGVKGKPLAYEDAVMAGLVAKPTSATAKELAKTYTRKSDVSGAGFPLWSGIQRMYLAGSMPNDGPMSGDLVLSLGGAPLGPASLGGCMAWYDASTLAYSAGVQIYRVDDLSGHGRVLAAPADNAPVFQNTSGTWARPRAVFSNASKNRWIAYSNSGDAIASAAGDYAIMLVASPAVKPDGSTSMVFGGAGSNIMYSFSRNSWAVQCAGGTFYGAVGLFTPDDTAHFFLYEYNNATRTVTLTIDGTEIIRGVVTGVGTPGINGSLVLGAQTVNGSNPYWGSISEAAVFDRSLTAQEKTDLRNVSRTRWAVA